MTRPRDTAWTRVWLPVKYRAPLDSNGFLEAAATRVAFSPSWWTRELAALRAIPCAVLLGEAGIGKSAALNAEKDALKGAGLSVSLLDIAAVGDETGFFRRVEHLTPRTYPGTAPVHVLVDGLDECRVSPSLLARWMSEWLEGWITEEMGEGDTATPRGALRLRIAARPGVWRELDTLPKRLERAFGDDLRTFELCPLTMAQAHARAHDILGDPAAAERFMRAVIETKSGPLAARPVTLNLLIQGWQERARLAETRLELYEAGLRALCRIADRPGLDARLEVSQRVAALSVLTGRPMLDESPSADGVLGFAEVLADGTQLSDLQELLQTGLFAPAKGRAVAWAHWSYAEFLAASYLRRYLLRERPAGHGEIAVWSLLTSAAGGRRTIAPQLEGVASWLAAQDPDLFERVLEHQPEVLLRGDPRLLNESQRVRLGLCILERIEAGETRAREPLAPADFHGLAPAGLAGELERGWIGGHSKTEAARQAAIRMARQTGAKALVPRLCDIALDGAEPIEVRKEATLAVHELGDETEKRRLLPLATRWDPALDGDEELRGLALLATWPDLIPDTELFSVLSEPRARALFGQYRAFLTWVLPSQLERCPELVIPALSWVETFPAGPFVSGYPLDLLGTVLRLAWSRASEPPVCEALARTLLARLALHEQHAGTLAPDGWAESEDDARRRLLTAFVEQLATSPGAQMAPRVRDLFAYVVPRDVDWAASQERAASPTARPLWCQLVAMAQAPRAPHIEPPGSARGGDRPEAFDAWVARQTTNGPDLWRATAGKLLYELSEPPLETLADLVEFDVWAGLDTLAQDRLRASALAFARQQLPPAGPQPWHAANWIPVSDALGVWALALVGAVNPDALHLLDGEAWCRWGPAIALCPITRETEPPRLARLLALAHTACPDAVEAAYLAQLDGGHAQAPDTPPRQKTSLPRSFDALRVRPRHRVAPAVVRDAEPNVWSDSLANALYAWVSHHGADSPLAGDVLDILLQRGHEPTRALVRTWLDGCERHDDESARRAVVAGYAFAASQPSLADAWADLWPRIQAAHKPVGLQLLSALVSLDWVGLGLRLKLDERDAVDVFLWVYENTSAPHGPRHVTQPPGIHERLRTWADRIPTLLVSRGSASAVAALEHIAGALPHEEWPRWHLLEAKRRYRAVTWTWPSPRDIDTLLARDEARLVRSADELTDAIALAFERIQVALHEDARLYWSHNREKPPRWWPKLENEISDALRRRLSEHLSRLAVVVHREVQVRPAKQGMGESADFVVAATSSRHAPLEVVIEAKGGWHSELEDAMESQLIGRYLNDLERRHGLYVIYWFPYDQCDREWARKHRHRFSTPEEARAWADDEAARLTAAHSPRRVRAIVLDFSRRR